MRHYDLILSESISSSPIRREPNQEIKAQYNEYSTMSELFDH